MNNGAFDDRDNARRHVKLWMEQNTPGDYTVGNLVGLARKMVDDDLEPVDDIRVQWAETSYGLLRGVVEFAADQLKGERAGALTWEAAAALPHRTSVARRHLADALDILGSSTANSGESNSAGNFQRARKAISLALMMLGTPTGRSVAA